MGVNAALAVGMLIGIVMGLTAAFGLCFLGYRISQTHIQEAEQARKAEEVCNASPG